MSINDTNGVTILPEDPSIWPTPAHDELIESLDGLIGRVEKLYKPLGECVARISIGNQSLIVQLREENKRRLP